MIMMIMCTNKLLRLSIAMISIKEKMKQKKTLYQLKIILSERIFSYKFYTVQSMHSSTRERDLNLNICVHNIIILFINNYVYTYRV